VWIDETKLGADQEPTLDNAALSTPAPGDPF
jgi:hypothetical protein